MQPLKVGESSRFARFSKRKAGRFTSSPERRPRIFFLRDDRFVAEGTEVILSFQ